jgi:hypothetical protein
LLADFFAEDQGQLGKYSQRGQNRENTTERGHNKEARKSAPIRSSTFLLFLQQKQAI